MLHFLTGMYYFTWFENLLIIIAGLSLGHFIQLIVQQVIAIRHHRSLTKIIRAMIPWLAILLVLMLSPVFASRIAVGWMVIIGIFECVIERLVITKFGPQLGQQHADRLTRSVHHSAVKQHQRHSVENEQSVKSDAAAQQARPAASAQQAQPTASAVKPAASAAQQTAKSAESESTAERQSLVATNQAASAASAESQPVTPAAERHQPTSQEIMDHMFDFDPNVDYEAEAKAAEAEAEAKAAADSQNQEDAHGKD